MMAFQCLKHELMCSREQINETDFMKITSSAPMGSRVFDLTQILETEQMPGTQEIAELLNAKTWVNTSSL